jgi:hypothetical protein
MTRYLIIAGTTRSASTSLFHYLSDHTDVCRASRKESCFFLDPDYRIPFRPANRWPDGVYDDYFEECAGGSVRMEASPDYMYSAGTAERVKQALPGAQLVFILRDPIVRVVSWYRFARQNGFLEQTLGLDDYVSSQLDDPDSNPPQQMRCVEQGHYAQYLRPFIDTLGSDRCRIVFTEELASDPFAVMSSICDHAGLDSERYRTYRFRVRNPSRQTNLPGLRRHVRATLFRIQDGNRWLGHLRPLVRRIRRMIAAARPAAVPGSHADALHPDVRDRLQSFYADPNADLRELVERSLPWDQHGSDGVAGIP